MTESSDESHGSSSREPEPLSELIQPVLDQIEQYQFNAEARRVRLQAAVDRLTELRAAAAKDHRFDDSYQAALDEVSKLVSEERLFSPEQSGPVDQ